MGFWRTFGEKYDRTYDDGFLKVFAGILFPGIGMLAGVIGAIAYSGAIVEDDPGIKGEAVSAVAAKELTQEIDRIAGVEQKIGLVGSFVQASEFYLKKDNPQHAALKAQAEADSAAFKSSFATDYYKIAARITTDRTLSEPDSKKLFAYLDEKITAPFPVKGKMYEDFLQECRGDLPSASAETVMSCTSDKMAVLGKTMIYGGPASGLAVYLGIPLMAAFGAHRRQRREEKNRYVQKIEVRTIYKP